MIVDGNDKWEMLISLAITSIDGGMLIWPKDRHLAAMPIDTCEHCHRSTWREIPAISLEDAAKRGWVRKIES